ncbi:Cupin [Rhizobium hainanense]|uniref:Cupin n=2 Tax=Rhizobium hainanense TaxID=52131 RepID=A0A1C3W8H1_9HYPH|nr:Cupin [Rhizobium hainanense]
MAGGFDARGDWSIAFGRGANDTAESIKCYAVRSGSCWLIADGEDEPLRLATGDAVILTGTRGFRIASHPNVPAVDFTELLATPLDGSILSYNGGGEFFAVGGYFSYSDRHASILLRLLPRVLHLSNASERTSIRHSLELMSDELRS